MKTTEIVIGITIVIIIVLTTFYHFQLVPYHKKKLIQISKFPLNIVTEEFSDIQNEDWKFIESTHLYNKHAESLFKLLNALGLEWWPTEGTLIGILRYGGNFGKLPSIGYIATDTDIDIMVRAESDEQWKKLSKILTQKIKTLPGFKSCRMLTAAKQKNVLDKITCYTDDYIFTSQQNQPGFDIHTDIHRYLVNEKDNYAYTNSSLQGQYYPFQHWNNKIPYRGFICDKNANFKKGLFNSIDVPCPLRATRILQHWNGGEYSAGQIAIPAGGIVKRGDVYKFVNNEKEGSLPINDFDRKYLKNIGKKLHDRGYESFYSAFQNPQLTIVSAFIEISSKHTKEEYYVWMTHLLKYKGPMVLFIDTKNFNFVNNLRKGLPTKIILTQLTDLSTFKFKGRFNHHLGTYYIDDSMHKKINMDEYSMIICEKPNFLKRAMDLNEFNTPYFLWLDMGYLRCGATFPDDWPNLDKLRIMDDKIVIMSLMNKNCLREDKPRKYTYSDPPHGVMVSGGIMGSHTKNINRFHTIFYQKLEDIINQTNEWAGMEQFILSHIYCENQQLFYNIKAKRHKLVKNNPWFYGIPYFAT